MARISRRSASLVTLRKSRERTFSPRMLSLASRPALLDVDEALGATSFEPFSHLDVDRVDYYHPQKRKFVTPCPSAGSIVVWDFRVLHRGNPNTSLDRSRPCLYSTLAVP